MKPPLNRVKGASLLVASALLLYGAFALPFLRTEYDLDIPAWVPDLLDLHERIRAWLIDAARIPEGDQYLWGIIRGLFRGGEYLLGAAVTAFSVVFPGLKIAFAGLVLLGETWMSYARRVRLTAWLQAVGRWSMADVFIVALVVVFFKAEGFQFRFYAGPGLYCYAGSALLSAAAVGLASRSMRCADE